MKYLCSICARGGSKGVKNKNIRPINGLELIAYTIIQAQNSKLFEHIIISTDSDAIAEVALKYGAEVFFKRSAELSSDEAAKLPVIVDAYNKSVEHFGCEFDTLTDLDASAPLRSSEDIKAAHAQFLRDQNDILVTACPSRRNPYFNMLEFNQGKLEVCKPCTFTRRQDAPKCYDMNASIYIFKPQVLRRVKDLFDANTGLYVMDEDTLFDVDSELDFEIVEFLIKKKNLKREDF